MSTAEWVTLTVGMAAAGVALVGYLLSQAAGRRQHKTHLFAEALEAVKAFEELPFRIAKRPASDATTRAELSNKVSDLFVKLGFYRAWTQIESPLVGEAYVILLDKTHILNLSFSADAHESHGLHNPSSLRRCPGDSTGGRAGVAPRRLRCSTSVLPFFCLEAQHRN